MSGVTPNELMELEDQNNPSVSKSNFSVGLVELVAIWRARGKDFRLNAEYHSKHKRYSTAEQLQNMAQQLRHCADELEGKIAN